MKKIISAFLAAALAMLSAVTVSAEATTYVGPQTISAGGAGVIDFTLANGVFNDFVISFGDQGSVAWTNESETGSKDFSWNINDPSEDTLNGTQAYINFPGTPQFVAPATVTLIIPMEDTSFVYGYDGTDYFKFDYEASNKDGSDVITFKTDKLYAGYVFSNMEIAGALSNTVTPVTDAETVTDSEDTTEEDNVIDTTDVLTSGKSENPSTGIAAPLTICGIAILSLGAAIVCFILRKKRH